MENEVDRLGLVFKRFLFPCPVALTHSHTCFFQNKKQNQKPVDKWDVLRKKLLRANPSDCSGPDPASFEPGGGKSTPAAPAGCHVLHHCEGLSFHCRFEGPESELIPDSGISHILFSRLCLQNHHLPFFICES